MRLYLQVCFFIIFSLFFETAIAQKITDAIRLNQVGFYPDGPKVAVIVGEDIALQFYIKVPGETEHIFTGRLQEPKATEFSNKTTRIADFSSFKESGTFVMEVPELGTSYSFEIKPNVYEELTRAAIKSYYFQRASMPLSEQYAGKWKRPAGHPDENVLVHSSAATKKRPAGTVISSPKGWYDAGDYNKYIVNSGITMGTLLSAYEDFPEYFQKLSINIPEQNSNIPDFLNEILWNLEWMLTMQDPHDGGVYHKLTNPNFDELDKMPHEATEERYVVQKTTAAALNFAAVMAQAARVFRNFNHIKPGFSDSCITAAVQAWEWAKKNPEVLYVQDEMNKEHNPAITTGAYGDKNINDEFVWAAIELYVSTKNDKYYKAVNLFPEKKLAVPSWNQVRALGFYTLSRFENKITPLAKKDIGEVKGQIVKLADDLIQNVAHRAYQTVMGGSVQHFIWGSNAVASNQGIALIQAYRFTSQKKYLDHALGNLDYLLGRNATGYSFVTGFGGKSPKNPHHRPSVAYNLGEPVPGLLVGGPNANAAKQDKCPGYHSAYPDQVFIDDECSYASNEVAINWNAPFVYLCAAIEALQKEAEYVTVKQ